MINMRDLYLLNFGLVSIWILFCFFFSFLFFEVLDMLSKIGECQVDRQPGDGSVGGGARGGGSAGGGASGGRQSGGGGQLDSIEAR